MDSIDVAWAAGLFEGEGCITVSNCRSPGGKVYRQARLKLSSTDEDVVRRFHAIVGGGMVRVDDSFLARGWKRQWQWYTGRREHVREVLQLLLPQLGARRRERAAEVLALADELDGRVSERWPQHA